MLSNMETALGMTVIGPQGQSLRILRDNPVFTSGKALLHQALPAEQVWRQLQDLLANPRQALVGWCARFGLRLTEKDGSLRLQDVELSAEHWLPLLNRTQAVAGSPLPLMRLAEKLGKDAGEVDVANLCLHWQKSPVSQVSIVNLVGLPEDVRIGDLVTHGATGSRQCLVRYDQFSPQVSDKALRLDKGVVIARDGENGRIGPDILSEPVILGFNQTYRCEEGSPDGWLEDLSFDSLKAARLNARDIQTSGSEVRIINRITGEAVALQ